MNEHGRRISRRFGEAAREWSSIYDTPPATSVYVHNVQRRRQHALDFLDATLDPILEVGCGAGNVLLAAPSEEGQKLVGLDLSVEMLREARRAASTFGAGASVTFVSADVLRLPFCPDRYGAVLALGVLEYVTDPARAVQECCRVLRPGGQLVLSVPNRASPFVRLDDWGFGLKNRVTHAIPTPARNWLKSRVLGRSTRGAFTTKKRRFHPQRIIELLGVAGFQVTDTRYHTFGFGLLDRFGFSARLCASLEARACHSRQTEKLGWTCILKAVKV